jgi:hypothetical protein
LYSSDGTVVASRNVKYQGKSVAETTSSQDLIEGFNSNELFQIKRHSQTLYDIVIIYGIPIEIGHTVSRWIATVSIPEGAKRFSKGDFELEEMTNSLNSFMYQVDTSMKQINSGASQVAQTS